MCRVLRRLQNFNVFARRKIASYLMCCGEAYHTSYARARSVLVAVTCGPRRSSDCEEVLLYSLNHKRGAIQGKPVALQGIPAWDPRKMELPFGAADSFLHVLFFARNRQVQHHKPTQHDGDGQQHRGTYNELNSSPAPELLQCNESVQYPRM